MSSASASPDSNPTRAQLRLVVLGQWVRAGLDLARRAKAGRGLVGGAVALWQVFQAIRLAIQLAQRLSELRGALLLAALEVEPGDLVAQASGPRPDDPPAAVACLRQALIEITKTIRDALGLVRDGRGRCGAADAASPAAALNVPRPLGRLGPPCDQRPDRPPGRQRRRARWRSPCVRHVLKTALTPLATPASGRFPLATG